MQATPNEHNALRAVYRCLATPALSIQLLVFGRPDNSRKAYTFRVCQHPSLSNLPDGWQTTSEKYIKS